MKFNSKILGILLALLAMAMLISAASSVDLVKDGFKIKVVSGADFSESVNIATGNMGLVIFENSGNNMNF